MFVALACLALLPVAPAFAEDLPVRSTIRVGRPPRPVTVRISTEDDGVLIAGARLAPVTIPLAGATGATIEQLDIGGHALGLVRVVAGARAIAALIGIEQGRPRVIWHDRTDLHGDPGERSAAILSLDDRTGDGAPDLVVGTRRQGAGLCGEETTLIDARGFDPQSGRLRPVILSRVDPAGARAVTATRTSPGPTGAPLIAAFRPTG